MNLHGKPLLRMLSTGRLRPVTLERSRPAAGLFVRVPDSPSVQTGLRVAPSSSDPFAASLSPTLFIGQSSLRI